MNNVAAVHTPSLSTLSVEVKALRVGTKQVTQSVFRQLAFRPFFDRQTFQENGVLWGWVNYFWGKCKDDHIHVVWQGGGAIYRDCVYSRGSQRSDAALDIEWRLPSIRLAFLAMMRAQWNDDNRENLSHEKSKRWIGDLGERWNKNWFNWQENTRGNEYSLRNSNGDAFDMALLIKPYFQGDHYGFRCGPLWAWLESAKLPSEIIEMSEVETRMTKHVKQLNNDYHSQYDEIHERIKRSDHLFIAV